MKPRIEINGDSDVVGDNIFQLLNRIKKAGLSQRLHDELDQTLKQMYNLKFSLDQSAIVAITDRTGRIQFVNDTFCQISQYSKEELIGKDHRIVNSGFHSKEFIEQMWCTILSGNIWNGDIRNRAKDGTHYWVKTTIVPFLNDDGLPYQFLSIRNDITKLKQAEEDLQKLMGDMLFIQEVERRKFSRELHDGIGQSLFSLLIMLDKIISDEPRSDLKLLRTQVSSIMSEVRTLAWELRPSVLDDLGIVPAIRTYIENFSNHNGIHIEFHSKLISRLDSQIETTIYRIIQESLTNIAKHAKVFDAYVDICELKDIIQVTIVDRGIGFSNKLGRGKGVGLLSMEERAKSIGANLEIISDLNKGTNVTLTIPNKK